MFCIENGVILDGESSIQPDIESREKELTSKQFHESSVNYGRFGLFNANDPIDGVKLPLIPRFSELWRSESNQRWSRCQACLALRPYTDMTGEVDICYPVLEINI